LDDNKKSKSFLNELLFTWTIIIYLFIIISSLVK
jgi:hypothetical protein